MNTNQNVDPWLDLNYANRSNDYYPESINLTACPEIWSHPDRKVTINEVNYDTAYMNGISTYAIIIGIGIRRPLWVERFVS